MLIQEIPVTNELAVDIPALKQLVQDNVTEIPVEDAVMPCVVHEPSTEEVQFIKDLVLQHGSPLLVLNCNIIREQYRKLKNALPSVRLYYAMKPLPNADVIRSLLDEGAFFDVATTGEIALAVSTGVNPLDCIHTHPIKRDCDISEALSHNVTTFVADNVDEIKKFVKYRDDAQILLRISFRNPAAKADLSKKFGCSPDDIFNLLSFSKDLGVTVKGICFHVGSQTTNPNLYVNAITKCREIIVKANAMGYNLSVLDIGGGFPINYETVVPEIDVFCKPINEALQTLPSTVTVYAEPGRFIAGPSVMAISSVMGKARRDGKWWYYLDDGLYGSYSGQLFDHTFYPKTVISEPGDCEHSVLSGPTCDSIDVIDDDFLCPELNYGDLVIGHNMGAYTWATATEFNFFKKAKFVVFTDT
ncbi:hypothetical protein GEMRC1_001531 [Eukaryota sp. GEM-RC1]